MLATLFKGSCPGLFLQIKLNKSTKNEKVRALTIEAKIIVAETVVAPFALVATYIEFKNVSTAQLSHPYMCILVVKYIL